MRPILEWKPPLPQSPTIWSISVLLPAQEWPLCEQDSSWSGILWRPLKIVASIGAIVDGLVKRLVFSIKLPCPRLILRRKTRNTWVRFRAMPKFLCDKVTMAEVRGTITVSQGEMGEKNRRLQYCARTSGGLVRWKNCELVVVAPAEQNRAMGAAGSRETWKRKNGHAHAMADPKERNLYRYRAAKINVL